MSCAGWLVRDRRGVCYPTIFRLGGVSADTALVTGELFRGDSTCLCSILRVARQRQGQPSAVILDGRTLQSTSESGPRADYDGYKRK